MGGGFKCPQCDKMLKLKRKVADHIKRVHLKLKPFTCDTCGERFFNNCDLKRHKTIHQAKTDNKNTTNETKSSNNFPCPRCKKLYSSKSSLLTHINLNHNKNNKIRCYFCNKTNSSRWALDRHLLKHTDERPFTCKFCYKRFTSMSSVHRHLLSHLGEQPFQCDMCSPAKSFYTNSYLQTHKNLHHSTTRKCPVCSRRLRNKEELLNHMASEHDKTKDKELSCDSCYKSFDTKGKLSKHEKIHLKSFKCPWCIKGFGTNCERKTHMARKHTKEKHEKCDFCEYNCVTRAQLFRHISTNHKRTVLQM